MVRTLSQSDRVVAGVEANPAAVLFTKVNATHDPERLIQLRRNRLDLLHHDGATEYTDIEAVRAEVREARRIFAQKHWPVIDVTRRSIEETAASVMKLLARRHGMND